MTQLALVHAPSSHPADASVRAMLAAIDDVPHPTVQLVEHDAAVAGLLGVEAGAASSLMIEQSGGLLLVGDVRIHHRDELCRALGCQATVADGPLVLAAYKLWGPACVQHLHGDYSLIAVDRARGSVVCMRDALGMRPLYYAIVHPHDTSPALVVSSDQRAMRAGLAALGCPPGLNEAFVLSYIADGHWWNPRGTFTAGVYKVPPGHTLCWHQGRAYLDRWWRPEALSTRRHLSLTEATHELRGLLETAIHDATRGVDGVGVHISGGLDSSIVAATTCEVRVRAGATAPRAYTWTPPPSTAELAAESKLVRAAAEHLGLRLHHHALDEGDLLRYLALDPADLPIEDTLSHELFIQEQAQRDGVSLVLSGFGGDELVSAHGQTYHSELLYEGRWLELLRALGTLQHLTVRQKLHRVLAPSWHALRPIADPKNGDEALALHHRNRPRPYRHSSYLPARHHALMLWRATSGQLSARSECYAAFGARHGVRYAFPLLDRKVVELALSLGHEHFADGRQGRLLARALAGGSLPTEVVEQPRKEDGVRLNLVYRTIQDVVARLGQDGNLAACDPTRLAYLDAQWLARGLTPPPPRRIMRFLEVLQLIGLARTLPHEVVVQPAKP